MRTIRISYDDPCLVLRFFEGQDEMFIQIYHTGEGEKALAMLAEDTGRWIAHGKLSPHSVPGPGAAFLS